MGLPARSKSLTGSLHHQVLKALHQACQFANDSVQADGHWCGELKSNCTITAEYVFLLQAIQHQRLVTDRDALCRYLLSEQNEDGSWSNAPGEPGDVSTSTEAYLALKILGQSLDQSVAMLRAKRWITTAGGGVENVRVFTRIYLATFGLLPWTAVPELPAELIFMPAAAPINIYTLSSWARSTVVPLLVVCHHKPIFALPNGSSPSSDFLDELWCDSAQKNVPYHKGVLNILADGDYNASIFAAIDNALKTLGGLRYYNPLRRIAINRCMEWIISHQETSGDWAGIFPPMHVGTLAYILEGYDMEDGRVRRALSAIEDFAWQDDRGKRMQACVSPLWDTVLMSIALSGIPNAVTTMPWCHNANSMRKAGLDWVKARQLLENHGDWRVYRRLLAPGGFSFEYHNTWYPDVDDTSAAIIAFLKDDGSALTSPHVLDAVKWVLGMQNKDGGWAAFDVENDKLFLNKIPFSDMDSLCDPSTSDIVGRVLEAFGLFMLLASEKGSCRNPQIDGLVKRMHDACQRGIAFLAKTQTICGAWYGRWGANYIYGTCNVLSGLAYHYFPDADTKFEPSHTSTSVIARGTVATMIQKALRFLIDSQNEDGGWGESLQTYQFKTITRHNWMDLRKLLHAPSTPSQTAWALMGLLPYLSTSHPAIDRGTRHLVSTQSVSGLRSAVNTRSRNGADPQHPERCFKSEAVEPRATSPEDHNSESFVPALTWSTERFTGTGFPNHFYLGYTFYSHYFPMMALNEYLRVKSQEDEGIKCNIMPVD